MDNINPVITKYEGEIVKDFEGCLSVKNIYGKVPRYTKVRVKALGLNGREFRVTAENFLARIFQHEIDHTNGIVFIDHIKDDLDAFYVLGEDGGLGGEIDDAPAEAGGGGDGGGGVLEREAVGAGGFQGRVLPEGLPGFGLFSGEVEAEAGAVEAGLDAGGGGEVPIEAGAGGRG